MRGINESKEDYLKRIGKVKEAPKPKAKEVKKPKASDKIKKGE